MEEVKQNTEQLDSNNYSSIIRIMPIIAVVIVSLTVWGIATKAGYIPNFLNLEILCSGKNLPSYREEDFTNYKINNNDLNDFPFDGEFDGSFKKPVIYLYPKTTTQVKVQLDYQGELIADYPDYNEDIKGWEVLAYPDGKLINLTDNQEYSYLFWEGMPSKPSNWDLSQGFIVKGEDTKKFLQTVLPKMGLTPKEYNEFIVYWYPLMKDNKYNLIHFAEEEYTKTAPLTITPLPDSMLRVFMVFKALDKPINIKEQKIKPFARTGFSVVEWGGTEIK